MENPFENKKILISGGTGSVGEAVIRKILKHNPKVIRILDVDETKQFELQEELKGHKNVRFLLGDIRDKERLSRAIEDIDIVFHTAALKHVLSCEYNPFEAIKTNIIGLQNIIDIAMNKDVEKVIFTSSDKAVNPCNVMGATKLLGERLITSANYYKGPKKTVFSSVRFGNIIGSRGSAVSLFRKQINKGEPVTITDTKMTRFVMPMDQATDLLFKATELAQGGEVFVFKMPSLRIIDLAEVMIKELASKYGYKTNDIKIKIIGSKPGEKIYEELTTENESRQALETKDMFIIPPEMKEFSHINVKKYKAKPTKSKSYKSKDMKQLSKQEILSLLKKENLL